MVEVGVSLAVSPRLIEIGTLFTFVDTVVAAVGVVTLVTLEWFVSTAGVTRVDRSRRVDSAIGLGVGFDAMDTLLVASGAVTAVVTPTPSRARVIDDTGSALPG